MERKSFLLSAAALTALAASNPMLAQAAPLNASDRNLMAIRRRLESYVDQLSRDQRDYGGHRASAIQWLQRAISELNQALQFDRTHG